MSPIVVIIKKHGEDIRLCIGYWRVNQLARLMAYPMPPISELLGTRERRQRRSHAGLRWKRVLQLILQGMIDGLCDPDILMDPMFMHFLRLNEVRMWHPCLSVQRTNIPNLITALSIDHSAVWLEEPDSYFYRL